MEEIRFLAQSHLVKTRTKKQCLGRQILIYFKQKNPSNKRAKITLKYDHWKEEQSFKAAGEMRVHMTGVCAS